MRSIFTIRLSEGIQGARVPLGPSFYPSPKKMLALGYGLYYECLRAMEVMFWGTRGGLCPVQAAALTRQKVMSAIKGAQGLRFDSDADVATFVDTVLPFSVSKSYGFQTACVQILGTPLAYLFCDAGSGLASFSQQYVPHKGVGSRFHFFLSHVHWDHIHGFLSFLPLYVAGNQIIIHTHHVEAPQAFRMLFSTPCHPVSLEALRADIRFDIMPEGLPTQLEGLSVRSIAQDHPGGSYGYRFETMGRTLVYSTDAEHREDAAFPGYPFVDFFDRADILIFDAQYSFAESLLSKANWGHSNNITAVELAFRAQVKHLVLFHNDSAATDEALDQHLFNTRLYADIYRGEGPVSAHTPIEAISLAYDSLLLKV